MSILPKQPNLQKMMVSAILAGTVFIHTDAVAQGGNSVGSDWYGAGTYDFSSNGPVRLPFDGVATPAKIYERGDCKPLANGTSDHPCVAFVPGKFGEAIIVGARAAAAIPYKIDLENNHQLTITAWIKQTRGGGKGYIVNFYDSKRLPSLKITGGKLAGQAGRQLVRLADNIDPLPQDEWVFVAGVWNFETKSLRLYQQDQWTEEDGLPMSTDPQDDQILLPPEFVEPGGDPSSKKNYVFIGNKDFINFGWGSDKVAIDDIRIFSRALSEAEIASVRNGENIQQAGNGSVIDPSITPPDEDVTFTDPILGGTRQSDGAPTEGKEPQDGDSSNPFDLSQTPPEGGIPSSDPIVGEGRQDDGEVRTTEAPAGSSTETPSGDGNKETRLRPVGPPYYTALSGSAAYFRDDIDLEDKFIRGIAIAESRDRPCTLRIIAREGIAADDGISYGCDARDNIAISWVDYPISLAFPKGNHFISKIQVCDSKNTRNHRVKGLQIWGHKINEDGSLTLVETGQSKLSNNCGSLQATATCPPGTLATGVTVHANDKKRNRDKADITGIALICRAVGTE